MAMEPQEFTWRSLGDIEVGRPTLGNVTSVIAYRLFLFSIRYVLEERLGVEETDRMLRRAGHLAGREFAATQLDRGLGIEDFIVQARAKMAELRIGFLQVEMSDPQRMEFTLTVAEDLDCSGVPISGRTICSFDEGFLAGIFERYDGRLFAVREIDCWASWAKTCRFTVKLDRH